MAEDETDIGNNPEVERALEKSGAGRGKKKEKQTPSYAMVGSTKVPVSKAAGKLWQSRRDQAIAKRKNLGVEEAWDEALKYYLNDQMAHRKSGDGKASGNRGASRRLNDLWSETENIVFANTNALVPALYAKNPKAEFTATAEEMEPIATILEELVNRLSEKKASPGINLKSKAKRAVVMAAITNAAYLEIGYTFKEQSSEQALGDLQEISDKLQKAKNPQEIMELEGQLMALEEKIDIMQPEGPWVKYRRPHQVLTDPDALEEDGSDARWQMVYDFIPTAYIQAMYGSKDESGKHKSIYQPTHVLNVKSDTAQDDSESASFSLMAQDTSSMNGYGDEESYKKAQRTKVWFVWDKTTRRVLMFNDADWTWPIWVWDDPYKLDTFFPFFKLAYYTNPDGGEAKGEVTYYLDQQDAINEMNDELRRARQWARRNIIYNKNLISKEDVDAYLAGDKPIAIGVDLPEDAKITDAVYSAVPPSMQFAQLFDITPKLQAIDRISSIQDFMRGAQFKTNTTNQAIQKYESTAQSRMDEKIDAVEDCLGDLYWGIAQLCLQHMTADTVAGLIGQKRSEKWQQMAPEQISRTLSIRVVGGSTIKPTSQQKKREAMEVGQVLGQFASTTPAVLMVLLKVFERAFDEVALTDQEWTFIQEGIQAQLQRGNNAPGGGAGAPGQGGGAPQGQGQGGAPAEGGDPQQILEQMAQIVDGLPPQVKEALGRALARGVPVKEAVAKMVGMMQQPQAQ